MVAKIPLHYHRKGRSHSRVRNLRKAPSRPLQYKFSVVPFRNQRNEPSFNLHSEKCGECANLPNLPKITGSVNKISRSTHVIFYNTTPDFW